MAFDELECLNRQPAIIGGDGVPRPIRSKVLATSSSKTSDPVQQNRHVYNRDANFANFGSVGLTLKKLKKNAIALKKPISPRKLERRFIPHRHSLIIFLTSNPTRTTMLTTMSKLDNIRVRRIQNVGVVDGYDDVTHFEARRFCWSSGFDAGHDNWPRAVYSEAEFT